MLSLQDWRGTPIGVGSVIVYPGRHGNSMWLTEGKVTEIRVRERQWGGGVQTVLKVRRTRGNSYREAAGVATLERIDRVTVIL